MTRNIRARDVVWGVLLVAVLLGGCKRQPQAAAPPMAAGPVEVVAVTVTAQ